MAGTRKPQRYEGVERRVQFSALVLAASFVVLGAQLWNLQVLSQSRFQAMAEDNRVWPKRLKADRGVIYGRGNVVLADNRASTDIVFVPGECPKERREEVVATLARLLGVSREELEAKIEANRREPFSQVLVKRDVTKADRIRIEEHSYMLPGVLSVAHPQRRYLYGKTAGQILGYLGEIGPEELKTWTGYYMGDLIGRDGLEMMYEDVLRGRDGHMLVTKYASGRPQLRTDKRGVPYIAQRDSRGNILVEEGRRQEPLPGNPLYLTLDIALQEKCESLLAGEQGAIVVLEANTGEVLALASSPGYDPSVFVNRGHRNERLELLSNTNPNRMLNRCFREHYPPGSLFKVVLAAAALEEGVIKPESTFFCPGHYQINNQGRRWACWRKGGHGSVNVVEALAFSCDVFFYNVGMKLGVDKISEWSRKMGLGEKTGIDLPGEISGLIPDREWKAQLFADRPVWERNWYPGETVNLSIGQGSCSTTPLQNAVMMACIINGGHKVRPHLNRFADPMRLEPLFSDRTYETVVKGLRICVEKGPPAPTGTGYRAHIPGMIVLGKTGTAQIMSLSHHAQFQREEDIPYAMRDHAWFVAGVVDREPRIAICILIEHGHHGGAVASPYAKEIIEFFYAHNEQFQRDDTGLDTIARRGEH